MIFVVIIFLKYLEYEDLEMYQVKKWNVVMHVSKAMPEVSAIVEMTFSPLTSSQCQTTVLWKTICIAV